MGGGLPIEPDELVSLTSGEAPLSSEDAQSLPLRLMRNHEHVHIHVGQRSVGVGIAGRAR